MTSKFPNICSCLFLVLFYLISLANGQFYSDEHPLSTSEIRVEKMTHLHFFFHDIVSGKHPSAVQIATPKTLSKNGFGVTNMADDRLTVEANTRSEVIGRAQGMYGLASQNEIALLMVMNYVFTKGKYNGSSIAIVGRNPPLQDVREMPIVGGTGLFRFARGYALAHTVWSNPEHDAIVEYHVYVYHF
ncbi:dirigent protein 21 [Beta vulgaris subsp. vulgaris]|uniref:dirigent protein 21 n=1 Tax=Beta vulgaris subsp. vulgaris TaxID=3555 RepID=UPI00203707E3|nr:dirigent protein 21 [Beta vulgaris subsp. vulgaris]